MIKPWMHTLMQETVKHPHLAEYISFFKNSQWCTRALIIEHLNLSHLDIVHMMTNVTFLQNNLKKNHVQVC